MRYIGIIILLVFCLTLLLLTGCIVNIVIAKTVIENIENQENTEEPVMWSGLGMSLFSTYDTSEFDDYVDTLLANGFEELRIDIPRYDDTDWTAISKASVIRAVAKGAKVIWGVNANSVIITAANWVDFRIASLAGAQWAEDNGVFEFQLGNEFEWRNDDTTLTDAQLIINLKSLATEVQAIFTNGDISYSCGQNFIDDWITAGKGDIDILASNIYKQWDIYELPWKARIDALVAAFGTSGTYLTEFNIHTSGLDAYSEDEAVQAEAVTEMIEYIKASGMTRSLYFCYSKLRDEEGNSYGVVKNDGTYRLLWNQALLNSGSVKSIPNTIALLAK